MNTREILPESTLVNRTMRLFLCVSALMTSIVLSEESSTRQPTTTWWPTVTRWPTSSHYPTRSPTVSPTRRTKRPTDNPTSTGTDLPTSFPTMSTTNTDVPTTDPTKEVGDSTFSSTENPTPEATIEPTDIPTSSPTLSPLNAAIQDKWPSLMKQIAQQTIEKTNEEALEILHVSPTISPTIKESELPSSFPSVDLPERLQFDYDPYSKLGPQHWGKIDVARSKYFNVIDDKTNHCDESKQSPIDVTNLSTCADDHTFGKTIGQTKFSEVNFEVTSNSLRGYFPQKYKAPRANWSNLSGNIPATWFDIKVMSEHWLFGQQYAGEFQLYFDHSEDEGKEGFVILSIMLDDTDDVHNPQLEQFIREWEEASWETKNNCDRRIDPTIPKRPRTHFNVLSDREIYDIWGIDKQNDDTKADFDIYRLIPTSWYCGYRGTLTAPPCTERIHWRIMDLPIPISRSQVTRMQNLLVNRLDSNCKKVSSAYKGTVNRPLQSKRKTVWCCDGTHWPLREKDPDFWYQTWPIDYHGWKSYDEFILNSTSISYQH